MHNVVYFLHFCAASNLSMGHSMTQALRLITVAHWAQNGKLSALHIRGEVSNVFEHTSQDDLWFKIVDRFSFQGNMVLNMTGDATNGKICFGTACMCKFALLVGKV